MGIGAPSCTVWQAVLSSLGTVCLYLNGAVFLYSGGGAYVLNDMGIGAPCGTVWQALLSTICVIWLYLYKYNQTVPGLVKSASHTVHGHRRAFFHRVASSLVQSWHSLLVFERSGILV